LAVGADQDIELVRGAVREPGDDALAVLFVAVGPPVSSMRGLGPGSS